jgi:hypothetical protein
MFDYKQNQYIQVLGYIFWVLVPKCVSKSTPISPLMLYLKIDIANKLDDSTSNKYDSN